MARCQLEKNHSAAFWNLLEQFVYPPFPLGLVQLAARQLFLDPLLGKLRLGLGSLTVNVSEGGPLDSMIVVFPAILTIITLVGCCPFHHSICRLITRNANVTWELPVFNHNSMVLQCFFHKECSLGK
jgi:hypothetical protein